MHGKALWILRIGLTALALIVTVYGLYWALSRHNAGPEAVSEPSPIAEPRPDNNLIAKLTPTMRRQWEDALKQDCLAAAASVHIARFDINDDRLADRICWRKQALQASQPWIGLVAIVETKAQKQFAYFIAPVSRDAHYAICSNESVSVTPWPWKKKDYEDLVDEWQEGMSSVSVSVADGECDPAWLFWPKNDPHERVEFVFARM